MEQNKVNGDNHIYTQANHSPVSKLWEHLVTYVTSYMYRVTQV